MKNWDKWQTFRKDRSTPPWIKLYRNLLSNPEWVNLSDSEKGQLVSMWILAADKNGSIPDDSKVIKKMAILDKEPNINKFMDLGFLVTTWLPDGCQPDANLTQQSREEERRVEERRVKTLCPISDEMQTAFKIFWDKYGLKQKRAKCEKLYFRLLKNESHDKIMLGVENYLAHLATDDFEWKQKQAPHTWLTNRGWEDEYEIKQFDPTNPWA